jgi:hydrogenase maturation protease
MNRAAVEHIANAVLYEGYILYPYRPSVKNRQRWTFGGLFPEAYCAAQRSGDASDNRTECLVEGSAATGFEAAVRFLHLTARQVEEGKEPPFRPVEALRVGDQLFQTWQEAEEREVTLAEIALGTLTAEPRRLTFAFPGGDRSELLRGSGGEVVGVLIREQRPVEGIVEASAREVAEGLYRVTLIVGNRTPVNGEDLSRDAASLSALVSTHAILGVREGEFVSLLDPPDCWREAAAACRNDGTYPVLAGDEVCRNLMLSSPIILYDYPQVAPESPGDLFDSTEIDEILTLRIMTMTDEEKQAMAAVDERAGALLARTEALAREELLGLHGTVRGLRPLSREGADD